MNEQRPPSQAGCSWSEECIEICTVRSVYVEERGVSAAFANPRRKQVRKVHFDGCYYTGREKRADYILSLPNTIDVIVELKGSDTNLKAAARQVESTADIWEHDPNRSGRIAALVVYGRIEGKKKLPGRVPRLEAAALGIEADFLYRRHILLLVRENGRKKFTFADFAP
jgi:hypothetical protein